jgi:leucyl aminopeptidase
MWQLPLSPEYREQLKSGYADIANIGGRDGGAITAAMFLKEFAGETPWIHLDIAGTAWNEKSKPDLAEGATGVLVRSFATLSANWRD